MEIVQLLEIFRDSSTIENLTSTEKVWAGLITTVLGMGITFVVLVVLQFIISLFDKLPGAETKQPAAPPATPAEKKTDKNEKPASRNDDDLVPVIAASLAMMLETSASNIVIRNITRVEPALPAWGMAGVVEQMQNRG